MKDDTISRQAAIDALRVAYWDDNIQSAKDDPCIVDAMTDWAIRQVKTLPSAQPERKTGKWIDAVLPNDNGGLPVQVCDQCNTFFPLAYTGGGHRFCPSCGAKMEVEHE